MTRVTSDASGHDVLVAVPAHDEAATIEACLASVIRAATVALRHGTIANAYVSVLAHRCSDDTAARARAALGGRSDVRWLVTTCDRPLQVGSVRAEAVARALARWPQIDPARAWLFNTDADSVVPPRWFDKTLAVAQLQHADAVAGMVEVVDWHGSMPARERYLRLVEAGLRSDGHTHAYAANLAVRLTTYQRAGGFPASPHGEEHALLDAIRGAGGRVASSRTPLVRTSGRVPGRAPMGLGALLGRLETAHLADSGTAVDVDPDARPAAVLD